jgi:hypothetical protein
MGRILVSFILGGCLIGLFSATRAQSEQAQGAEPALKTDIPPANVGDLPPVPPGKSTVFGGEIRTVDPVRDELMLKVYGQKPMKILFDERTLAYLDGRRIHLSDLHPEDHAAVETTLDGTRIFAVSIHALSRSPEGDYQGRVVNYNPGTGELTITSSASREPFTVTVAKDATFKREGQPNFVAEGSGPADLRKGSLVSVEFESGQGRGIASQISVLAVPGAAFAFSGNVASLDLHSGSMVLIDPRDQKSYQISFDSAHVPSSHELHIGQHVSVKADYDGTHYVANQIAQE